MTWRLIGAALLLGQVALYAALGARALRRRWSTRAERRKAKMPRDRAYRVVDSLTWPRRWLCKLGLHRFTAPNEWADYPPSCPHCGHWPKVR